MFSYVHNFEKVEGAFGFQLVHPSIMHNINILYTQHMACVHFSISFVHFYWCKKYTINVPRVLKRNPC